MEELKTKQIVEEVLAEHEDLFVVDVRLKGGRGNQKLLVFIDGDEGLTIDRCSQISRRIGALVEERDVLADKYVLEVSSPGLDFPLLKRRQYKRNVGRTLAIKLKQGSEVHGELVEVEDKGLKISHSAQLKEIAWDEIEETKIRISFK